MGTYRKRDDGRWEVRVCVPTISGTKKRKSFYADSEKTAKILMYKIETDVAEGKYVPTDKSLLAHYIDIWFNVHKKTLEDTTKASYEMYIEKHIKPVLGNITLQKITPLQIQDMYNSMIKKGLSANTVKHAHAVLNQVIKSAVSNNILLTNPMNGVKLPKLTKFKPTMCTQNDYKSVVNIVKDHSIYTALILAARAGLRRGEIAGLRWSDIDFNNKTINVEQVLIVLKGEIKFKPYPKTEQSKRKFTVDDITMEILKKQKEICDQNTKKYKAKYLGYDLVVCRENGKYIRPDGLSEAFRKIADKCGLGNLRLHDLRHFNATIMAMLGIDVKTAATRFGDRPDTMLQIYTHTLEEMDKEAANKINTLLNK